jgi:hypothetical protein
MVVGTGTLQTIREARAEDGYRIRLTYADGFIGVVDLSPLIRSGGVFASLANPGIFAQLSIGERGRTLEWPGDLEFCADALRMQASPNE